MGRNLYWSIILASGSKVPALRRPSQPEEVRK